MISSYLGLMRESPVHLTYILETKEPVELGDFVAQFVAIGNEFERFVKEQHKDLAGDASFFVKEVRKGSTIVDMIPAMAVVAPFIANADQVMIVEDFVRRWGKRLSALISDQKKDAPTTPQEFKDFSKAVTAIARDPNATSRLEAAVFEDGKRKVRYSFEFTTSEARAAEKVIEHRQHELEKPGQELHERVLMVFTRSDVHSASLGKPSGEKVMIEEISDKSISLTYGSDLAERKLKHEIREADENVYKKGFIVDVHTKVVRGKPVAYAVTHVHDVIDIEEN
jgi:nucleotide-binding universal stress UspA family protein